MRTATQQTKDGATSARGFAVSSRTMETIITKGATAVAKTGALKKTRAAAVKKTGAKRTGKAAVKTAEKAQFVQYTSEAGKVLALAFLYNMRNSNKDVSTSAMAGYSEIRAGGLYVGKHGVCVAQRDCKGLFARAVSYKANGKAQRGTLTVECMHIDGSNYAVGKFNGKLANIELDRFNGQTKKNRFALVA